MNQPTNIPKNKQNNFIVKANTAPQSTSMLGKYFSSKDPNSKLSSKEATAKQQYDQQVANIKADGFSRVANTVNRFSPEIRNPLLQSENFYLPQPTTQTGAPNVELNRWFAHYYRYHPLIGNLIDLHSQLPLSRFGFKGIDDPSILRYYEEMSEDMDLFMGMVDFLKTWFLFGETQPYLFWNEDLNRFDHITFLDTSYIEVFGHTFFHNTEGEPSRMYTLIPDPLLVELLNNPHPRVKDLVYNNLPQEVITAVTDNKVIIMHNFNTEMVMRTASPWDIRGTSMVMGCLKELMYEDKLREAQHAIAEAHVAPKWIWKLGQAGEYMPTTEDITAFKDVLISAHNDPIFNLVTHYALNVEVVGSTGRILPIVPELQYVETRILTRMFSNKALVSGEGVTYANASVALRALMSRYIPIRAMAENFFKRKVFLPTALANDFYKRKKADLDHGVRTSTEELILPEFNWSHKQNLLDDSNIKNMLVQLRTNTELPMKVICDALDLDYSEVKSFMKEEQGTVLDPVARKTRDAVISEANVTQPEETPSSRWRRILDVMTKYLIPTDQDKTEEVTKDLDELDTTVPAATDEISTAPPPEQAKGPSPGGPEASLPEEAAEVVEPNVEAPLGAAKQFDSAPTFDKNVAIKEAAKYFTKDSEGKRILSIKAEDQFNFLKSAPKMGSYLAKKTGTLLCTSCDWSQHTFLNSKVVKAIKEENWTELELDGEDRNKLIDTYESLSWKTIESFKQDKKQACPKCKQKLSFVKAEK